MPAPAPPPEPTEEAPGDKPAPVVAPHLRAAPPRRAPAGPGFSLQAGGGIADFTNSELKVLSQSGGYWDVRFVVGAQRLFGVELAYLGSAHPLSSPDLGGEATLVGHGAEGNLRLNLPIRVDRAYVIPFVMGGLGWQQYRVVDAAASAPSMSNIDDVAVIPVGGGVRIGEGHLFLETRFAVRLTVFDDFIRNPDSRERRGQLRHWTFGANLGYAF